MVELYKDLIYYKLTENEQLTINLRPTFWTVKNS